MTRTKRRRWWLAGGLLVIPGVVVAASCSQGLGYDDCLLLARTLGEVAETRCDGGDAGYTRVYNQTINVAANYNCANITSVRDDDALRNECIPCLLDAGCYDVTVFCAESDAATLPDACLDQLQL
jgi:hypothetical protein